MIRKKLNNKGFSLVELLLAVVLLAIVVLPLLQVFTLGADITRRSRKIGEATAIAQNIQETIVACGVDAVRGKDESNHMTDVFALNMLGGISSDDTTVSDDGSQIIIRGFDLGYRDKILDAKVYFDPVGNEKAIYQTEGDTDVNRSLWNVNGKPIAQYSEMRSHIYSQPFITSQNPDDKANQDFLFMYPGAKNITRDRSIIINVESTPERDSANNTIKKIDVTATVYFEYQYYFDLPEEGETNCYESLSEPPANEAFEYKIDPISSYDEEVACFLMYYPFYDGVSAEDIIINIDRNNDNPPLKFKLFLVKQVPMIKTDEGTYYSALDPTVDGQEIIDKDRNYEFSISEYHNKNYTIELDSYGNPTDKMMNVYTNAHRQIGDSSQEILGHYEYKIKSPHSSGYFFFSRPSMLRNQLVKTAPENRLYDVTIEIYNSGKVDDEDAKPICELKASRLK
ncbi:MAG: prepilin-type N-terminal cleavage/methylation domain-containing protein [Clostridia bacterium]|nr:prepilin-type N-terminal cleavage/methylation domain-containing protein [Clostridia bacterium]